jgi:hypothetical protein
MPAANARREMLDDYGNVAGGGEIDAPANFPNSGNFASGQARGLFDPKTKDYRALDVVAFNGSEWRARRDNPGPLPGDGWMLSAKAGTRGKPGERGKDGLSVKALDMVGYSLVLTLSDGTTLRVNLLPMLELYESERPR